MTNTITTSDAEFESVRRIAHRAAENLIYPDYSKEFLCLPPEQATRGLAEIANQVARYVVDNGLDPDDIGGGGTWGEQLLPSRLHYEFCLAFDRAPPPGVVIAKKSVNFGLQSEWDPQPWEWQDPGTIAPLECLLSGHYWRGEVGITVAPGGVGKSILSIGEALAAITGKPILGEATRGGLKVMILNYEDSALVLRHRWRTCVTGSSRKKRPDACSWRASRVI